MEPCNFEQAIFAGPVFLFSWFENIGFEKVHDWIGHPEAPGGPQVAHLCSASAAWGGHWLVDLYRNTKEPEKRKRKQSQSLKIRVSSSLIWISYCFWDNLWNPLVLSESFRCFQNLLPTLVCIWFPNHSQNLKRKLLVFHFGLAAKWITMKTIGGACWDLRAGRRSFA